MRTPHIETKPRTSWTIARMCLTVAGGTVINLSFFQGAGLQYLFPRSPDQPANLTWLNLWVVLSLVLDAVCLWSERRSLGPRLVDVLLSALGTVVLASVALAEPGTASSEPVSLTLPLALLFGTTVTVTIVKLGLLLEGKQAIIQLTDA